MNEAVIGDPNSILKLGPAAMKSPAEWRQMDSDILAHFLQVHGQLSNSKWYHSKTSYTMQGENILGSSFPTFESFVFAAVYLRQLISSANKDNLFDDAVNRYVNVADCQIRNIWMVEEKKRFAWILDNKPLYPTVGNIKVRELFNLFLYGSGLMHKIPDPNTTLRKKYLKICDTQPRQKVLFALNSSLKLLIGHVNNVAIVMHHDYSHWLNKYSLPCPEIRWHDRLFEFKY